MRLNKVLRLLYTNGLPTNMQNARQEKLLNYVDDERAAEGEPVVTPGIDRTPRVEQLIRNVATSDETITARNPGTSSCSTVAI